MNTYLLESVPLSIATGDAVLLDTNVLVGLLNNRDPWHQAAHMVLEYLIFKKAKLYICETVVVETIHVFAKNLYLLQRVHSYETFHHRSPQSTDLRGFVTDWYKNVLKCVTPEDTEFLRDCNRTAATALHSISKLFKVAPANRSTLLQASTLAAHIPIGSADAVLSTYANRNVKYLVTFDRDLRRAADNPLCHYTVISSNLTNSLFLQQAQHVIANLGDEFKNLLIAKLGGQTAFDARYPLVATIR